MQAWLQEFAWTEAELPQRLRERQSTLAHADSSRHRGGHKDKTALMSELSKEPMFCFEVGWRWIGCSRLQPQPRSSSSGVEVVWQPGGG